MKRNKILLICLFLSITASIIGSAAYSDKTNHTVFIPQNQGKQPKNIILLIGDGMGLTQISAGLYSNHNHLNLEERKMRDREQLILECSRGQRQLI